MLPFAQIWAVDFEFQAKPGELVQPWCLVARELKTGREIRQWYSDFGTAPPYDIGEDSLVVCYSAIAEMSCHLVLGWPMPKRILDLYVEFRRYKNGLVPGVGSKLIQALEDRKSVV